MYKILLLLFSLSCYFSLNAQEALLKFNEAPQEQIFVHYNTSFLLAGENLYYTVYCLHNNRLSELSKIAYIEIINEEKEITFRHKVVLEKGIGQGDFFIPPTIITGNYKLVAYTKLMKNFDVKIFFQADLFIVNPYQKIIKRRNTSSESSDNSKKVEVNFHKFKTINLPLKLTLNKKHYLNREKVTLNLLGEISSNHFGNYSISVRKLDTLNFPYRLNSVKHNSASKNLISFQTHRRLNYIPELRGELISGKIKLHNNLNEKIVSKKVALTITDETTPVFKIANSNDSGIFHFNIDSKYRTQEAFIQVLGYKKKDYEISFNEEKRLNYNNLQFKAFNFNSSFKNFILERSISNQIQNAYADIRRDSLKKDQKKPLFNNFDLEYILDDYKRFPTFKETIIEVIDHVWYTQKNNNYFLHVRGNENIIEDYLLPMVLVDGILIQNHNELIDFKMDNIEKIKIIRNIYVYGPSVFGGVISIETKNKDYSDNISNDYIITKNLTVPQIKKQYYKQNYSDIIYEKKRIPDFRHQLYWNPNLTINKKETKITFFTSDISGKFEISIEGFTVNGQPISLKETFFVN